MILIAGDRDGDTLEIEESNDGTHITGNWVGKFAADGSVAGERMNADDSDSAAFRPEAARGGAGGAGTGAPAAAQAAPAAPAPGDGGAATFGKRPRGCAPAGIRWAVSATCKPASEAAAAQAGLASGRRNAADSSTLA